eukprot:526572-Prorocentrum_minimum.AAC.1
MSPFPALCAACVTLMSPFPALCAACVTLMSPSLSLGPDPAARRVKPPGPSDPAGVTYSSHAAHSEVARRVTLVSPSQPAAGVWGHCVRHRGCRPCPPHRGCGGRAQAAQVPGGADRSHGYRHPSLPAHGAPLLCRARHGAKVRAPNNNNNNNNDNNNNNNDNNNDNSNNNNDNNDK